MRAVGGVDVDEDDTGAGGGVLHEDPLDAVAGPDAGAVTGGESEAGETAGDAGGFAIEFAPGEANVLVADDEGFAVGETGGGVGESLGDGLLDEGRFGPAGITERWQRTSVAPWAADKFVRRRRWCFVANIAVRKCKRTTNRTNLSGPAEQAEKRAQTAPRIQDGMRGGKGQCLGRAADGVKSFPSCEVQIILCLCD